MAVPGSLGDMAGMGENGTGKKENGKSGETLHRADLRIMREARPRPHGRRGFSKTAPV